MPSIREVAKEAGVSIATVSRVMNGAEGVKPGLQKKVAEAVKSCNYVPAVGKRSNTAVALVYPEGVWVGSPYDSACVQGIVERLRDTPYDLVLIDGKRDKEPSESLAQSFARKGVLGAIVRSTSGARGQIKSWATEGLPLVLLGDHFDCPNVSFVFADSARASREGVEHLISLGHRRIAFAACHRDDGDHHDRLAAYREAVDAHGLADPALIHRVPPYRLDGVQLVRNLMGMADRPTALFVADPLVAVGVINEAHRMGVRIPEDLSIVGFDDSDTRSFVHPRMTAVCQDAEVLGSTAAASVLSLISEGPQSDGSRTKHEAWLDIGSTTGPPPASAERILPTGTRIVS